MDSAILCFPYQIKWDVSADQRSEETLRKRLEYEYKYKFCLHNKAHFKNCWQFWHWLTFYWNSCTLSLHYLKRYGRTTWIFHSPGGNKCDGVRVCVGEGLHGLAGMACLVVLLKQKHSRGFKSYQMVVLSLSESALLQPCVSEP